MKRFMQLALLALIPLSGAAQQVSYATPLQPMPSGWCGWRNCRRQVKTRHAR